MSSDVLIVGGGLVGTSLAIALSRAGVRATLVETRAAGASLADPARERYLALSRASVNALKALDVWSALAPHVSPIQAVHVSRRGGFGRVLLQAGDYDVDRFGVVTPASRLGQALEAALQRCGNLARLSPATLQSFECGVDEVKALIDQAGSEQPVHASLIVGADGVDSFVRTHAGLPVEREDYGQDALVLSVGLSREHRGVAYERFTDDGAMALLPLPERRAGLVWTLPRERAERIENLSEHERIGCMQAEFGQRLGRFRAPGHLIRYPLSRSFADTTHRDRIVIIGNAAQNLHPVAAQGFNLGLRDALVLAEEICAALPSSGASRTDRDAVRVNLGHSLAGSQIHALLRRYGERRRADRERIATLSHWLARWPKVRAPGIGILRSLALGLLNGAAPIRHSLVLAAMGFGEDAPALALDAA